MSLGELLKERRNRLKMSQADVARMVPGLTRGALNNIENGATKSLTPEMANALAKVLPVTVGELLRAQGFDLPTFQSPLAEDILEGLEKAPEPVLDAVRLLLSGYQASLRASR